jgi:putative phosphonate metabolism protein
MRYAIYFAPSQEDPLGRAGITWLGRDAYSGTVNPNPAIGRLGSADIAFHTAAPRRYGFHATLKAPFRLANHVSEADLVAAFDDYCAAIDGIVINRFAISRIGRFFALTPADPDAALNEFAAGIVRHFDPLRAELTEAEIERRQPDRLSLGQFRNLQRWGYPYVMDEFRFHMTLTGPVPDEDLTAVEAALHEWFGEVLREPATIGSLALFNEIENGAPFLVLHHKSLGSNANRMTA